MSRHPQFGTEFEIRIDPAITTAGGRAMLADARDLHAFEDDGLTGEGVTVAVADSGVDPSHPVFEGVDLTYHDFTGTSEEPGDAIGHGTAVAGVVAQLAPDVELVVLRVFGERGSGGGRAIEDAYRWLLDNAGDVDLVNFSWGSTRRSERMDAIHDRMVDAGVRDVVAAGNTGGRSGSPATAERAFSAGAVTEDGEVTRFNSYDPNFDNPDVSALGKDLLLARAEGTSLGRVVEAPDRDGEYVVASGTSFSAPIVTAAVARWMERHGRQVRPVVPAFEHTATNVPGTPREGAGMVDYAGALDHEPGTDRVPAAVASPPGVDADLVTLNGDVLEDGQYAVDPVALRQAFGRLE